MSCALVGGLLDYCVVSPFTLSTVPTRSTSYSHLRDGFMRALQARQVLGKQRGQLSPDDELAIQSPLRKLKSMFPNTPLAKHTPLDILTTAPSPKQPRTLIVRDLGSVQSEWLAREFVLAYFEGQGLSPPVSSLLSCEARLLPKTDSLPSSRSRWWSMLRSTCNCCVFG